MSTRARIPFWVVFVAGVALLCLCLLSLAGCYQSDTRSEQQAVTHAEHHIAGSVTVPVTGADSLVHPVPVPIDLTWTTEASTDTTGKSQTKAGLDPAAIAGALTSAIRQAFPALSAMIGQVPQSGWNSELIGGLATGATGLLAAGGALLKARFHAADAAKQKADADEAWDKLAARAAENVKP